MDEQVEFEAENRRLRMVIEGERSIAATAASKITRTIAAYSHLLRGRGSYEFDDDKWRDEFRDACAALEKAAGPLAKIGADRSDGLNNTADVMAARRMAFDTTNDALFEGMQIAVEAALREDVDDPSLAITRAVFGFLNSDAASFAKKVHNDAVRLIARGPIAPPPDPGAHSWEAYAKFWQAEAAKYIGYARTANASLHQSISPQTLSNVEEA